MNNRHKYFRNLRYKQKLESQYEARRYEGIYFYTKEPDPRYEREHQSYWYWRGDDKYRGHNYYMYYDRPEVDYTIYESPRGCYRSAKQYFKKYSNKKVRRAKDIPNHNQYRKVFDLWWTID